MGKWQHKLEHTIECETYDTDTVTVHSNLAGSHILDEPTLSLRVGDGEQSTYAVLTAEEVEELATVLAYWLSTKDE